MARSAAAAATTTTSGGRSGASVIFVVTPPQSGEGAEEGRLARHALAHEDGLDDGGRDRFVAQRLVVLEDCGGVAALGFRDGEFVAAILDG